MSGPREKAFGAQWRRSLDADSASSPQLWRYANDPREGDCIRLLPARPRRRALFLGNALAILPTVLAGLFESVVVADCNSQRLALAEQRRDEDSIGNLVCVLTSGLDDLPDRLGQFDLVALGEDRPDNGWLLPFADPDVPRRLASAIVPAGCLMYGVRFPHFGGLVAAARLGKSRRPLFYPAHARVLAAAGFAAVRAYGRRPDTRPYEVYVPLDDPGFVAYWIRKSAPKGVWPRLRHAAKEALVCLGGWQYLFNNFLVIARKSS
jgi:hypothetical protein